MTWPIATTSTFYKCWSIAEHWKHYIARHVISRVSVSYAPLTFYIFYERERGNVQDFIYTLRRASARSGQRQSGCIVYILAHMSGGAQRSLRLLSRSHRLYAQCYSLMAGRVDPPWGEERSADSQRRLGSSCCHESNGLSTCEREGDINSSQTRLEDIVLSF